jgi:hypothetical protein
MESEMKIPEIQDARDLVAYSREGNWFRMVLYIWVGTMKFIIALYNANLNGEEVSLED